MEEVLLLFRCCHHIVGVEDDVSQIDWLGLIPVMIDALETMHNDNLKVKCLQRPPKNKPELRNEA